MIRRLWSLVSDETREPRPKRRRKKARGAAGQTISAGPAAAAEGKPFVAPPATFHQPRTESETPDAGVLWNRSEIARMWGVSPPTVDGWLAAIEKEFTPGDPRNPIKSPPGGKGRAKQIDAEALKAWHEEKDRSRAEAATQRAARLAELHQELDLEGGKTQGVDALSFDDRRKYYETEAQRIKVDQQRRALVPRERVREEFAKLFRYLKGSLESLPDRIEQKVELSPEALDALEAELVRIQQGLGRTLMETEDLDGAEDEPGFDLTA